MDHEQQIYLQFHNISHQRLQIESVSLRLDRCSEYSADKISLSRDEPIEERLLQKTSQLHQSLRNKKLLQFEWLQAEIMKKQTFLKCEGIEEDLMNMDNQQRRLLQENNSDGQQLNRLEQDIRKYKKINQESINRIDQVTRKIAKSKQEKGKLQKDSVINLAPSKKIKEHGYISIEAIRLEAQNQSKREMIQEIKTMINEVKANITRKQNINGQLELEYQSLLKLIQQEQQQLKRSQNNSRYKIQEEAFLNVKTQKSLFYEQAQKENNMNHDNMISNRSVLNNKQKQQESGKFNSQGTVNKPKGKSTSCLKNWFETGRKHLAKKIY